METVTTWEEIVDNIFRLESYRHSSEYSEYYLDRLKRGICFVVFERGGRLFFGPSRFIGYKNNNIDVHTNNEDKHGGITNKAITKIIGYSPRYDNDIENEYLKFCLSNGVTPTGSFGGKRKYWFYGNREIKNSLESDIQNILGFNIKTEEERQILIRIGQGNFRASLINLWNGCSVTSCKLIDILRASHIKPWSVSNDQERMDKYNGLLLVPNLDIVFDKGIISFDNNGEILISNRYNHSELKQLGIHKNMKIDIKNENRIYLDYHRNNIFVG
ncbi:HNH endonuclease [Paenibacillus woosongensis]|uniref:HNH endonuclease n=1 Tax=Paenibacillus woosongensis TaxID=307580 RepID=A0A7X2Z2J4_9BACL|nr:HNH endonuclease [Paenibacillus woosongensis]MUG46312.1 HNH endonuclease [Paenibacillus woosongensis]